jgi:hypothetical protein
MASATLRMFFASGSLGPVGLGADRAIVETTFGPPDDFDAGSPSPEGAQIWKYGDVEFHFERDQVWLIHIDRFSGSGATPIGSAGLDLDPWVTADGLALDTFVDALKQSGLEHAVLVQPKLDRTLVTFPSYVHVGFSGVSRENARLEFISQAVQKDLG